MAAVMFVTAAGAPTCKTSNKIRKNKMPTPIEIVTAFCAGFPEDGGVILPVLTGFSCRIHAAIFSF